MNGNSIPGDTCGTPQEGCDCIEPGKLVECGTVEHSAGGFVACSMGHRQCIGAKWGACVGDGDIRTRALVGGGLRSLALGIGARCGTVDGGFSDPCDPYCNAVGDDPSGLMPEGGLVVSDGGLTIPPTSPDASADAGPGGPLQTTSTGDSTCAPGPNLHNDPCNAGNQYTQCQQDFRCDLPSGTCVWNGAEGYFDSTVAGVDLTIGASCASPELVPVCNRGSGTVAAGAPINIHLGGSAPAPDSCVPAGPVSCTAQAPAGGLTPGRCIDILCPISGNSYGIVEAPSVTEPAGLCKNNQAYLKNSGAPGCAACTTCNTQVSGKVYDPSGPAGNNIWLAGVSVFQPSGALTAIPDGLACDSCDTLDSPYIAKAITAADGTFTLNGVTPGPNTRIVVQSGRWRREITIPVNACANNAPAAGTFRMPRDSTEGTIPRTAVVTGNQESLGCMLRKIGVSASEMGGSTGAADPKRIQFWRNNGMDTSPAAPSVSTLFNTATLARFSAIIQDCPGGEAATSTPTAGERMAARAFVDQGGHLFGNHYGGDPLYKTPEFPTTSTWLVTGTHPPPPSPGRVLTGTPPQQLLNDWLFSVGAMSDFGNGWIRVDQGRITGRDPVPGTTQWIRGQDMNAWGPGAPPGPPSSSGNYEMSYSYETPFVPGGNCGVLNGTGRVLYNGMHINPARGTTGTFPGSCNLALAITPEEKALEYQLFQLTACRIGGAPPPPPPPLPPPLPSVTYTRDYVGVCAPGERVKWGPFYWQAAIPPGTSIKFSAATAADPSGLPASPPAAPPTTALVGTAIASALPPGPYDCTGCPLAPVPVDAQLLAQTMKASDIYLRVYMTFNPTATVPPSLLAWRQIYDCVPAE